LLAKKNQFIIVLGDWTDDEKGEDNKHSSDFCQSFKDNLLNQTLVLLNQTLVLTDVHSRARACNWLSPHAYSMYGVMEDEYVRVHEAGKVGRRLGDSKISLDASLENYSSNMIAYLQQNGRNCDAESDFGILRDYGFIKCVTYILKPSSSAERHLLACQDRTEGVMVESLQPLGSRMFLGSYNQVAMLLVSAAVLSSFVMFLSGGMLLSKDVAIDCLKNKGYDSL
jgi:hypothetical protein